MKCLKRTAQGFNPGLLDTTLRALEVAPEVIHSDATSFDLASRHKIRCESVTGRYPENDSAEGADERRYMGR
jgi:hypothetical protein